MMAAWTPPSSRTLKDFEGHDSVTLVYYLGTCLAAEGCGARCPAELRRPPAAAACPVRPPIGDWVVLSHPSTTPEAANTVPQGMDSGRNGCLTGLSCWPRGLRSTLAVRRLRAGGAAFALFWGVQWAGRGRMICVHHGGPVGRLYPASSHPPRPGAARLAPRLAPNQAC